MPTTSGDPRALVAVVVDGHDLPLGGIDSTTRCDMTLVHGIARLQLEATRLGWTIRLTCVEAELGGLIELAGLAKPLGLEP